MSIFKGFKLNTIFTSVNSIVKSFHVWSLTKRMIVYLSDDVRLFIEFLYLGSSSCRRYVGAVPVHWQHERLKFRRDAF